MGLRLRAVVVAVLFLHALLGAWPGRAATVELVSIGTDDTSRGDDDSLAPSISRDGRRIVFVSKANLAVGYTPRANAAPQDVFLRDSTMLPAVTTLLSPYVFCCPTPVCGCFYYEAGDSTAPFLSPDGDAVVFTSTSADLDPTNTAGELRVFRGLPPPPFPLLAGIAGPVADDGRFVFQTIVAGRPPLVQAYLNEGGSSRQIAADSVVATRPVISATGALAYQHKAAGDPKAVTQVYRYTISPGGLGVSVPVSVGPDRVLGDRDSEDPAISRDGAQVAFASSATNLSPLDASGQQNVFVRDLTASRSDPAELISVSGRSRPADGASADPSMSEDGCYVAFTSAATNLVPNADVNKAEDVFVRDRCRRRTFLVTATRSGTAGGGNQPAISGDGTAIAFVSAFDYVTNEVNACALGVCQDVYVRRAVCRDGKLDWNEDCDDGNATAGDGCEPDCRLTPPPTTTTTSSTSSTSTSTSSTSFTTTSSTRPPTTTSTSTTTSSSLPTTTTSSSTTSSTRPPTTTTTSTPKTTSTTTSSTSSTTVATVPLPVTTTAPACTSDAACADGDPCTLDQCDPGRGCVHPPAPDGTACDNGTACLADTCRAGVCRDAKGCGSHRAAQADAKGERLTVECVPDARTVKGDFCKAQGFMSTRALTTRALALGVRQQATTLQAVTKKVSRRLPRGSIKPLVLKLKLNKRGRKELTRLGRLTPSQSLRVEVRLSVRNGGVTSEASYLLDLLRRR